MTILNFAFFGLRSGISVGEHCFQLLPMHRISVPATGGQWLPEVLFLDGE
jgi:hypothetical protein